MDTPQTLVTNEQRVTSILKGLVNARSLLTITLEDSPKTLTTTLLDLIGEGIVLDELVQAKSGDTIAVGSRFSAFSKSKGIPVSFQSEVRRVGDQQDGSFYVCALPESLNYSQKRSNFRLPASGKVPDVRLSVNNETIPCKLADISEGGSKLKIDQTVDIEVNEIYAATIQLGDNQIKTQARICHQFHDQRRRTKELGVEWKRVQPKDKRLLREWIFSVERKRLRGY